MDEVSLRPGDRILLHRAGGSGAHPYGKQFMTINQARFAWVANNRRIGMEAMRTLLYLLATMDKENKVDEDVRVIADSLGMQQSSVYRALKTLETEKLIATTRLRRRVIVVDFHLCWKGSRQALQDRYAAAPRAAA